MLSAAQPGFPEVSAAQGDRIALRLPPNGGSGAPQPVQVVQEHHQRLRNGKQPVVSQVQLDADPGQQLGGIIELARIAEPADEPSR